MDYVQKWRRKPHKPYSLAEITYQIMFSFMIVLELFEKDGAKNNLLLLKGLNGQELTLSMIIVKMKFEQKPNR